MQKLVNIIQLLTNTSFVFSDLMYELRNIQHGERPVTGQNNKEKIGKFLTRHFPSDGEKEQPPSDEEDHRPETVVMEVRKLDKLTI